MIKRVLCVILTVVVLCACSPRAEDRETWQTTLPASGVTLDASGHGLETQQTRYYERRSSKPQNLCLIRADDVVLLTLDADAQVEFAFASPQGDSYRAYNETTPIEKVDYVPLQAEDDQKQVYRVDTAYSFLLTITSDAGTDVLLLDCRREI